MCYNTADDFTARAGTNCLWWGMKQISAPEAEEDALHLGVLKQLIELSLSERKRQHLPSLLLPSADTLLGVHSSHAVKCWALTAHSPPASSTSCRFGKEPPFSLFILIWEK